MNLSAAPRLVALLGLVLLASCPAAAQSRAHGFRAGAGGGPPRAAYQSGYGGPRPGAHSPGGAYAFGPYGQPPPSLHGEYAARPYATPGYPSPLGPYAAPVGGGWGGDWRAEQYEVRRAVRDGRHVPLSQAIAAVRQRAPGHVLDAAMEAAPDGRPLYRLRWATNDGRRIDYLVDAATGAIVGAQ
jgi:hypothetical protein